MKVYDNFIHKYYASILLSKNHEDVSSGSEYELEKRRVRRQKNVILDLLLNNQEDLNGRYHYYFLF